MWSACVLGTETQQNKSQTMKKYLKKRRNMSLGMYYVETTGFQFGDNTHTVLLVASHLNIEK